jgi:two-component system sensor histidine kinase/response regulator
MRSYGERPPLLDFLYRKPGGSLPDLTEEAGILEDILQDAFDDLRRSTFQLRQQVSALKVRNKELEEYAHMVAHDLQEPLSILVLTSNVITDIPDLTSTELKEYLQQIGLTASEMKRIITSLLLFAEVSRAQAPLEPVQMKRVVANAQDRLSYMIKQQQAQIILPEAWPEAIGYEPWIEEVWTNYLSNAIKYGGRPLCVELGASARSDGMLRFWTRDNGPGIAPEARTRLFIPYHQIGRLKGATGHGLGLSIVLSIVEKLGGQVGVESELGKGSLFFFTLPASPAFPEQTLLPS